MHKNIVKKKGLATITIFTLIIIGFLPAAQGLILKENNYHLKTTLNIQNNGTLSGYVRDPSANPIEGALVRVYFHDEYRENYSDSTGYYHVVDIPICYCLKNATCSKEGYQPQWVLLAIYENTTYDFTLFPLDPCYPVFNGTVGWNGWYTSPVEVSFVYDPEEVAEIWYDYHGLHPYNEPFLIDEEGEITVDYYWIDHEGEQSPPYYFTVNIDQTPPTTFLQWEVYKEGLKYYVKFTLTAEDILSGMAPNLLVYINNVLQAEFEVIDWGNVVFKFHWLKNFKYLTFGFACFDNAGNMAYEKVNGSDIKSCIKSINTVGQKSFIYNLLNLLEKFLLLRQIFI